MLQEQELELSHQITDAVQNVDSQYHFMQTLFNRRLAAEEEVQADEVAYAAGTTTLDILLQAEQERSIAEAAYYRALIDYNRAISEVHFVKGSLPEYDNVFMAEGPWPGKAYFDARRLARSRDAGIRLNYGYTRPDVFSRGEYPQFGPTTGANETHGVPEMAAPGSESIETPQPQGTIPSALPGPDHSGPNASRLPGSVLPQSGASSTDAAPSSDAASELKPLPATTREASGVPADGPQLGSAGGSNRTASANGVMSYPSSARRSTSQTAASSDATNPGWRSSGSDESVANSTPVETDQPASSWQRAERPVAGD
jgi:hypothetical protein